MPLKCLECRRSIAKLDGSASSHYDDCGETVFDCPHCDAKNTCILQATPDGLERYVCVRVRTCLDEKIFFPCTNADCRAYGNHVTLGFKARDFYLGENTMGPISTSTACPDCGTPRSIFIKKLAANL